MKKVLLNSIKYVSCKYLRVLIISQIFNFIPSLTKPLKQILCKFIFGSKNINLILNYIHVLLFYTLLAFSLINRNLPNARQIQDLQRMQI